MSVKIFVDTNVLVSFRDSTEGDKQILAGQWLKWLWDNRCGCLSYQVLMEYYVTVTQKLTPGLDSATARNDVMDLLTWNPLAIDSSVVHGAWKVQDRYLLSWWDALIVSAAHITGSSHLLTEDLQQGQEYFELTAINPFVVQPHDLV